MQKREKQTLSVSHEKQKKVWLFSKILLNDSSGWTNQGDKTLGHLALLPNSSPNAKPFIGNVKKKKVSNSSGEEWRFCLFLIYKMTNRELGLFLVHKVSRFPSVLSSCLICKLAQITKLFCICFSFEMFITYIRC